MLLLCCHSLFSPRGSERFFWNVVEIFLGPAQHSLLASHPTSESWAGATSHALTAARLFLQVPRPTRPWCPGCLAALSLSTPVSRPKHQLTHGLKLSCLVLSRHWVIAHLSPLTAVSKLACQFYFLLCISDYVTLYAYMYYCTTRRDHELPWEQGFCLVQWPTSGTEPS